MVFLQTFIHLYRVTIKVASLYFGCIVISILYLRQSYYNIFYGFMRDEYVSPNFEGGYRGITLIFIDKKSIFSHLISKVYGLLTRKIMKLREKFSLAALAKMVAYQSFHQLSNFDRLFVRTGFTYRYVNCTIVFVLNNRFKQCRYHSKRTYDDDF